MVWLRRELRWTVVLEKFQGYVESSNVNAQQLVDMIETQRAYEVSSKSITAVEEMMQFISRNL